MSPSTSKKTSDERLPLGTVTVNELDIGTTSPGDVTDAEPTSNLEKNAFSNLSAFGFCFAVLNTWCVLVVGLGASLSSGGPSAAFWGFIWAFICNLALTLSHSEILAVFPTAGGQYHWAAMLAPPRWKASISWTTGLMNVISLWLGQSTVGYLATSLLVSAIRVNMPDWAPTSAQQFGIFVGLTMIGPLGTPFLGVKGNRYLDTSLMLMSIFTSLAIIITLFATASPKASASFVFGGLHNVSGWDSMVIAWLIGTLQAAFSFLGFDLVYHISEEMPNPRREAPRVVNMTIVIGGISGILVTLAMLFAVQDIDSLLGSEYGPFAQLVLNSTGSKAAATIFLLVPGILFMNSSRGVCVCASRVLLSLGRDKVLPYSDLFQVVKRGEPVYGLALSVIVAVCLGAVQLGSTSAFNSLLGSSTIMFQLTYVIPPALMLLGGRKRLSQYLPARTFNLGNWGVVLNILSCFFVLEGCVIYCFPATLPVEAGTMNYVVVYMAGFGAILSVLWYTWAKKRFPGPSEEQIISISNRDKLGAIVVPVEREWTEGGQE